VAKKTVKKTTKKKTVSKSRPKKAAASPPAAAPRRAEKGKNPLYVLIIMALVTAIALMVNRYSMRDEGVKNKHKKNPIPISVESKDKKDDGETRDEKKKAPDKKVKAEKTERIEKAEKAEKREGAEKKEGAEKPPAEEVKVYFVKLNEKSEKMYLAPVTRTVNGGSLLENTMKELIRGPTAAEKKKGHLTAVPSGLRVNSVKIKNRSAEIDFNGAIEQGAGGSILINRIDQIVYTATQFPNVKSVVIKINGKQRQTLGTDGLSIGGPLHRR
jgi:spore germination protein GerM